MALDLPYGYDTLLDREFKNGHDLSGGQWQRLVAARSLYRHARLLVCDEPPTPSTPAPYTPCSNICAAIPTG